MEVSGALQNIKNTFFPQFSPKMYTFFKPCGMKEPWRQKIQKLEYTQDSKDSGNIYFTHTIALLDVISDLNTKDDFGRNVSHFYYEVC